MFSLRWPKHKIIWGNLSNRDAIRFIQSPALALLYGPRLSDPVPGPRPSGSASVHEISATKHVAWFTFSLLLWRQLLWNKFDGQIIQLYVANVISFSYSKEPFMKKTELRARKTSVIKIIRSVDPYENYNP